MLTTILKRPYFIARHQELPLREEREAFLKHLRDQGTSHAAQYLLADAQRRRGELQRPPPPLAAPKYTCAFVPYVYSRQELKALLNAVALFIVFPFSNA